jgi:hypothetical protein
MRFADAVRGATLKGPPPGVDGAFDRDAARRLGRALATLLARRGVSAALPVIIAHADEPGARAARDGVIGGLLLSGRDVLDLGAADSELFAFGLRSGHHGDSCAGGVHIGVTGEGADLVTSAMLFLGVSPLLGASLAELAQLADAGPFVVGAGVVHAPDLRRAFRAEPAGIDVDIDYTADDTAEGQAL